MIKPKSLHMLFNNWKIEIRLILKIFPYNIIIFKYYNNTLLYIKHHILYHIVNIRMLFIN